ncbi:hypothetical protein F5Y19DRAFT_419350 [Xylariaceae sp. FL1651]|nr:hypothetical protein F5Y19DRAFT_419350 [Xylariaceae sp. FL1651]
MGELVLERQMYLLQSLNIIIEDILEEGSTTRSQKELPKKSSDSAAAALSKLSIQAPTPKLDLASLLDSALDQKASLDDNLVLICTEPVVLSHAVNIWFFSRPELVADEKGRMLPALTDRYISTAVLDTVHSAVKGAAIWNYMCRLLELLRGTLEKPQRAIILQDISNLCHLEYSRAQALFKRHVSTGTGSKWFKRVSNAHDNGNARVALKGNSESLVRENPQLHCLLRLCQPEVTASKAIDWLKKIDNIHNKHPSERDNLQEREVDALGDLAIIVSFVHSLSSAISMPTLNRKKGQRFVSGSADLEAEVNHIKPGLDLADFAIPIDNLLEPGMAEAALKALDEFVIEKTGTKLGLLYLDLIDDCMTKLEDQLKAQTEEKPKKETKAEYVPFPLEAPQTPEVRVQQRRQKEKTRPAHSSGYDISSSTDLEAVAAAQPPPPPSEPFMVKSAVAEVFSTLFNKSDARGSVPWVNLRRL